MQPRALHAWQIGCSGALLASTHPKPSSCHPSGRSSAKVYVPLEVYMSLLATSAHSPPFGMEKSPGPKETFWELPWLS